MDRFWGAPQGALLHKVKNGKKELGADSKLVEPTPDKYATKNLTQSILNGAALSNGYQDALQDIFYLAAVLPSFKNGFFTKENLTISGNGTTMRNSQ